MTEYKLQEILTNHRRWLCAEDSSPRANLSRAELSGVNLSGANLSRAYLSGANLRGANLRGTDLSLVDLSGANLSGANLSGANLSRADLVGADLSGADLSGAELRGADLIEANLSGADLSEANLCGANLCETFGIVPLPVHDPRGYRAVSTVIDGKRMIFAGCHAFTIHEAREHWGGVYEGCRAIGDMYLAAIDWLESLPDDAYTYPDNAMEYTAAFMMASGAKAERAP